MGGENAVGDALVIMGVLMLYVLPIVIATQRQHHQIGPIAVINILLGWTLLGWIAALCWSVSSTHPQKEDIT